MDTSPPLLPFNEQLLLAAREPAKLEEIIGRIRVGRINPNEVDTDGYSALHYAAVFGDNRITSALIEAGADVNYSSNYGKTPIFFAAERGLEGCELLLNAGAHVDARDNFGQTPLFDAVASGRNDVVLLLLEKGANANALDKAGQTPMHEAVLEGQSKIMFLILLIHGASLEIRDTNGHTATDLAEIANNEEFLSAAAEWARISPIVELPK